MKIKLALFAAVGVYYIAAGDYVYQIIWILCFLLFMYTHRNEK